jgi:hypothetical protein
VAYASRVFYSCCVVHDQAVPFHVVVRVVIGVQQVERPVGLVCQLELRHPVEFVLGDQLAVETVERDCRQRCFFLVDVTGMIGIKIKLLRVAGDIVALVRRAAHAEALVGVEIAGPVDPETSTDPRVRVAANIASAHCGVFDGTAPLCTAIAAGAFAADVWHRYVDERWQIVNPDAATNHAALVTAMPGRDSVAT